MAAIALLNGRSTDSVAVTDRGLAYGDGLFETIKVVGGNTQFLAAHLARLTRDCARLDMQLDLVQLRSEIAQLVTRVLCVRQGDGVLKLIITRRALARGYQSQSNAPTERLLVFYPQVFPQPEALTAGVQVRLCRQRLAEQPSLAGIKHLNRLEQVLARAEWSDPAVAEGLMLDQCARLIEGTMSNLFLVRGGSVYTPRLHRCGVAGIVRELVLQRMAGDCAPVCEADLTLDDLIAADEVFLTNSLIGIWPVLKIDCLHKRRGDVTIAFQQSFQRLCLQEPSAQESITHELR
jgi:4-amino-4-deoxychorismate lyase